MPFYRFYLKPISIPQNLDLNELYFSDGTQKEISLKKFTSRLVRDHAYRWISNNIKSPLPNDVSLLTSLLRRAYALIIEVIVICDFSGENISNLRSISYVLNRISEVYQACSYHKKIEEIDELHQIAQDMYNYTDSKTHLHKVGITATYSRKMWFIWGQSLLKIARHYLLPANEELKQEYISCIEMAINMFERCIKGLSHHHYDSKSINFLSECHSSIAFGYILKTKIFWNDVDLRTQHLLKAESILLNVYKMNPNSQNATYNLSCISSILHNYDQSQVWFIKTFENGLLPPNSFLEEDSDLDNVRDFPWFKEIMKKNIYKPSYSPLSFINDSIGNIDSNDEKNEYKNDEDMKKLYASLVKDGLTQSSAEQLVKEIYKDKIKEKMNASIVENEKLRLHRRLLEYSMIEKSVIPSDGNCQFASISDQIFDTIDNHRIVRQSIVEWLKNNGDSLLPNGSKYKDFIYDMTWEEYCETMSRNGIWGDNLTLQAAAEYYGKRICIISSIESEKCVIEIVPKCIKSEKPILLSHYAEYHYGSITYKPK